MTTEMMPDDIPSLSTRLNFLAMLLLGHRFRFSSEVQLQESIAEVLTTNDIKYEREYQLTRADRLDFLVQGTASLGGIVIETKIDGSLSELTRQVHRYAQHEAVDAILVVTNLSRLRNLPAEFNGKPIRVVYLRSGM